LTAVVPLSGFFSIFGENTDSVVSTLDSEISKTVVKPNIWGYTFFLPPSVFNNGLTYWFDGKTTIKIKINSIEDAERLYTDVTRDFIQKLNSIRIIRPFLAKFPLTPSSCYFSIVLEDTNGSTFWPPYIASIKFDHDVLKCYRRIDLKGIAGSPFEEIAAHAGDSVDGLKDLYHPKFPRKAVSPKPKIPTPSCLPMRIECPFLKAEFEIAQKICKNNALDIVILGCVGEHYFDSRPINFALRGPQSLSLDESRKLAAKCSQELWDFIRKDKRCLEYIKETSSIPHEKYSSPTPILEHLAFRISFWDENVDRVTEPYIAEIRLLDAKLKYFTADENQFLVQVYEETFDNALAFLHNQKGIEPSNPN
jgi:hypothetical protein